MTTPISTTIPLGRRAAAGALALVIMTLGLVVGTVPAAAATNSAGYRDGDFTGVANAPTADKPQSKLWYNDGLWWADMFDSASKTWHIFRLDRSANTWVDTGTRIDDRTVSLADTLWDGQHLYVASNYVSVSDDSVTRASVGGRPARFYRFSYSSATKTYKLDTGFPVSINDQSSESITIDKDSTGKIWATWTQVSGSASAGYTSKVYANATNGSDSAWGTPFVIAASGANASVAPDDISAVVSFSRSANQSIGVLWSNHLDDTMYWAVHKDGDAVGTWKGGVAARGSKVADDHLNLKTLQADSSGRVFGIVKTSLDETSSNTSSNPQINLLVFKPATGSWTSTTVGTIADCHTRPIVMLDETNQKVHVLMTAGHDATGCANPGPGWIYDKVASLDNPVFPAGRGTMVIGDPNSPNMNNVTSTKQSVTSASGLVVLASDLTTSRYWHADIPIAGSGQAPTAAFTASKTSGTAPVSVQFTDTSTGSPTAWAWNFGDGSTSTSRSPAHTYSTPGTYSVKLTASNASGSNSTTKTNPITVSGAPTGSAVTRVGSSSAFASTAASAVTLSRPAGTTAGDVLVASVTADFNPSMSQVPAGWTPIVNALSVNSSSSAGARIFAYYHVVGSSDPSSYTWTLSAAQKWGGGVSAYRGVNVSSPLDAGVATAVNASFSATSVTVPSVTTATPGAMVVGGVGIDSTSTNLASPPAGWTERFESGGGQNAEGADKLQSSAGATGSSSWSLSSGRALGGWQTALKPAG